MSRKTAAVLGAGGRSGRGHLGGPGRLRQDGGGGLGGAGTKTGGCLLSEEFRCDEEYDKEGNDQGRGGGEGTEQCDQLHCLGFCTYLVICDWIIVLINWRKL